MYIQFVTLLLIQCYIVVVFLNFINKIIPCKMYKLSNRLLPEALNELYIKIIKYNIIPLEIVINIIFKQVLTVFQMLVLAFGM